MYHVDSHQMTPENVQGGLPIDNCDPLEKGAHFEILVSLSLCKCCYFDARWIFARPSVAWTDMAYFDSEVISCRRIDV